MEPEDTKGQKRRQNRSPRKEPGQKGPGQKRPANQEKKAQQKKRRRKETGKNVPRKRPAPGSRGEIPREFLDPAMTDDPWSDDLHHLPSSVLFVLRSPALARKPLYAQYRARREQIQLTHQALALRAGVSLPSVTRELGVEPGRPMSLSMALRLGDALGFDAAHVALAHAREVAHQSMHAQSTHSKTDNETTRELFRRVYSQLDAALWMHNPFPLRSSGQRLALLFERCRRGISLARLAHHTRHRAFLSPTQLSRYERGRMNIARVHERRKRTSRVLDQMQPDRVRRRAAVMASFMPDTPGVQQSMDDSALEDTLIDALAGGLTELAPEHGPVTRQSLDRMAASFRDVHHVNDTLEWKSHRDVATTGNRFLCPEAPGYGLFIGTSPTLHDSMEVKLIRATKPGLASEGCSDPPSSDASSRADTGSAGKSAGAVPPDVPIRVFSGRCRGMQLGVVISGHVDFALGSFPFSRETMTRVPEYQVGRDGIFHMRSCKAGDVAVLSGGGYRRIAFHSPDSMVAIISIRSNLILN